PRCHAQLMPDSFPIPPGSLKAVCRKCQAKFLLTRGAFAHQWLICCWALSSLPLWLLFFLLWRLAIDPAGGWLASRGVSLFVAFPAGLGCGGIGYLIGSVIARKQGAA